MIVASPLPPTPGKVFRRLPGGLWRNLVAEVFRRLQGEIPETPWRAFRRPGGGQGGGQKVAGEESREDSREESREDSRERPGGDQSGINSLRELPWLAR